MQKSLISVLLVATLVAGTQGLQCYSCYDVKGLSANETIEGMRPHTSCEHGKTPENSLRVTCQPANFNATVVIQPICVQVHGNVRVGNTDYQGIARGCANVIPAEIPRDECGQSNIRDLKAVTVGPMNTALNRLTDEFGIPESTSGTFCHCNSDNCNNNPAPMVTPGSMAVVAVGAVLVAMKSMF